MKTLQTIGHKATTKLMEATFFFSGFMTLVPGKAFAQVNTSGGLTGGSDAANDQANLAQDFPDIFRTIVNIILFLVGAVAVIMLVIGGFKYVVSGGDSNAIESAKNTILYAIIGIVVAFLAYAAVNFVLSGLQDAGGSPGP